MPLCWWNETHKTHEKFWIYISFYIDKWNKIHTTQIKITKTIFIVLIGKQKKNNIHISKICISRSLHFLLISRDIITKHFHSLKGPNLSSLLISCGGTNHAFFWTIKSRLLVYLDNQINSQTYVQVQVAIWVGMKRL